MTMEKMLALILSILLPACFCLVGGEVKLGTTLLASSKKVIESFQVYTDIRYRFATTKMCSVVRNTASTAQEMTFDVTLPKDAFIVSFAMTIDGKVYDGEVKEKAKAKKQYQQAVQRGRSAGHIRQTPRHANRFDVSVNVANGTAVNFTLTYQQILSRKLGLYEYEMHVEPGQPVEDFNVEVFIQENRRLLYVKTPKLRTGSTLSNNIEAPNDLTIVNRPTEKTAHIEYKPTIRQQGDRGLAARFVVQYDVDHSDNGAVLVADGYFIHMYAPQPRQALPKDIIFVLDVSGSMIGTKIAQLKDAMKAILEDLTERDRFDILTFSDRVSHWKRALTTASPEVVKEAQEFVTKMRAGGMTNINMALLNGLKELRTREVETRVGMIFFLTDGDANTGETNTANIARNIKNGNDQQTAIYSLAFGAGANFESLKTISAQNVGYARKIYEASDAALQVESLYDEISTVAMKKVSVTYLPSVTKTTETVFPLVQNGTEIFVCGRIDLKPPRDDSSAFHAKIDGTMKKGAVDIILDVGDIEEVTIDEEDSLNSLFTMTRDYSRIIEKMWAFMTIKQMLRKKETVIEKMDLVNELDKKILEMSLKYKFVTPLTSMVVTKPDSKSTVHSGLVVPTTNIKRKPHFVPTTRYMPRARQYFPLRVGFLPQFLGHGSPQTVPNYFYNNNIFSGRFRRPNIKYRFPTSYMKRKPHVVPTTTNIKRKPHVAPTTTTNIKRKPHVAPTTTTNIKRKPHVAPTTTTNIKRKPHVAPTTTTNIKQKPHVVPTTTTNIKRKPHVAPTTTTNIKRKPHVAPTTTTNIKQKPHVVPTTTTNIKRKPHVVPTTTTNIKQKPHVVPTTTTNIKRKPHVVPTTTTNIKQKPHVVPTTTTNIKRKPHVAPTTTTNIKRKPHVVPTTTTNIKQKPHVVPTTTTNIKRKPHVVPTTTTNIKQKPHVAPTTTTNIKRIPHVVPTTTTNTKQKPHVVPTTTTNIKRKPQVVPTTNKNGTHKSPFGGLSVLRSIVLRTHQASMCIVPEKIPSGKYLLAEVIGNGQLAKGIKAELTTSCLKECRIVVPEELTLTSSSSNFSIKLTPRGKWNYSSPQHPDLNINNAGRGMLVLTHQDVTVSMTREQEGRRTFFSIVVELKAGAYISPSSMMDLLRRKMNPKRKADMICGNANAHVLKSRKALKYKV